MVLKFIKIQNFMAGNTPTNQISLWNTTLSTSKEYDKAFISLSTYSAIKR
jgi:hypothetical protein